MLIESKVETDTRPQLLLEGVDTIANAMNKPSSKTSFNLDGVIDCASEFHEKVGEFSLDDESGETNLIDSVGSISKQSQQCANKLLQLPVLNFVEESKNEGISSQLFFDSFIAAFVQQRNSILDALKKGSINVDTLVLKNQEWLIKNSYRNILREVGVLPPIDYDELHRSEMYCFTNSDLQTNFAVNIEKYRNGPFHKETLINGKEILTIGAGNGSDERFFSEHGAKSVETIEGSKFMVDRLQTREHKDTFHVPENPVDMLEALLKYKEEGRKFDTIYGHSVTHYFDKPKLKELLRLFLDCLKPEGYLAFAVKAPGAILDGNGIPLIVKEDERKRHGKVIKDVEIRAFRNFDGQARYFRDEDSWTHILESVTNNEGYGLDVRSKTAFYVEDYESKGNKPQRFHYFVYRKEKK